MLKDINYLYQLSYDELKKVLLSMNEVELKEILSDYKIKEKLINFPQRYYFIWLAQEQNDMIIPLLLDNVGLDMLVNSNQFEDKLEGILTSGNNYLNILFNNKKFLNIIIENINKIYYFSDTLSGESAKKLLESTDDSEIQLKILCALSGKTSEELVKIYSINEEILMEVLLRMHDNAIAYLLKNDYRITSLNTLNFSRLLRLFQKKVTIPRTLLEEKEFVDKITSIYDCKTYRFLIEELKKNNDVELFENKRKEYYEKEIRSYNREHNMLNRHYKIYAELCLLIDRNKYTYEEIKLVLEKYMYSFDEETDKKIILNKLTTRNMSKEELKEFFQKESNYALTNMVIDYHFEDIYYNVLQDLKQLYKFQMGEGRTLDNDDIKIYGCILNLDKLPYDEKIELYEKLKKQNIIGKYYDDFRASKNKSFGMIKEQMLNFNNIHKYKNEELSQKHGVDIYVLDGEPFYAFVKSLQIKKDHQILRDVISNVDGASYSLDGYTKLKTFIDPKENYNIMYGDFNVDQVVHMYPVDSFSKYIRNSDFKVTKRVNELYIPNDFVSRSKDYNEIVYAQKNGSKSDDLNQRLDVPKMLSIYCYDEITDNDIRSAKILGIGITLIKTDCYNVDLNENKLRMQDTIFVSDLEKEINYLNDIYQDAMHNRRR